MKLIFLFTGKTEDQWIKDGMRLYLDRLAHYCSLEVVELPAAKNKGRMEKEQVMLAEAELVLSRIDNADHLVLMDEGGKELSSVELSKWLNKQQLSGAKKLIFLVGGPFGFHPKLQARANQKLSLSKLTFTHQMVRVILAEQIYRAFTILKGEKYHHE